MMPSMLAFKAERKAIGFRKYEETLARGTSSPSSPATTRGSRIEPGLLGRCGSLVVGAAAEYKTQADDHRQRGVRFQRAAS